MNPTVAADPAHFDVRPIPCRIKHGLIFQRWQALAIGEHFVLINDHDPVPLYYQFAAQYPGAFDWEYLEAPADEFRVRITRRRDTPSAAIPAPPRRPAAPSAPALEIDARGLEPPEPMMRILAALESLSPGGTLQALTDRRPIHLLPEIEARGIRHEGAAQADGSWLTCFRRD